jgi:hypothetical protein
MGARLSAGDVARGDRNWETWLIGFGSHDRLKPFLEARRYMTDEEYWPALRLVFDGHDAPSAWAWRLRYLLAGGGRKRAGAELLMTEEERARLGALPPKVTIYRGFVRPGGTWRGWSWTLSRERAEWFARRPLDRIGAYRLSLHGLRVNPRAVPHVATARVAKRDVLAFLGERKEEEILVDPRRVALVSAKPLRAGGGGAS